MKNIYLEQDEEIISVVDKIVQSEENSINLFIPLGAQILQSSINLKLLKRESDNLGKELNLIIADDLGAEMAEKIGFNVKKETDFPVETIKEEDIIQDEKQEELETTEVPVEENKIEFDEVQEPDLETKIDQDSESELEAENRDMIDFLVEELKPEKETESSDNVFLAASKSEESRKRMADIVNPKGKGKPKFFEHNFFNRKSKEEKIEKKPKEEKIKIIQKKEQDVFLNNENREINNSHSRRSFRWPKFVIIFAIIIFLIACLIGYLVLPKSEVIICPDYEKIDFDLSVIGSQDISQVDVSLNKIPIQEIEVSKTSSKEFDSTGEKQLNEKAKGFITVYNGYDSSPQVLLATTRFESSNGKIFRIPEQITIPGAKINEGKIVPSSIEVEVFADEPGEEYNIDPSNFTIPGFKGTPKYAGFYAKSNSSMTGGSTKKVKIVSAEDLEKAKEILSEEVRSEVLRAFEEQIPTDLKMIESSLDEDIIIVSTVSENTKTDKFTLEIKAVTKALLFKEKDIRNLIDLNVISIISEGKEPLSKTQKIKWGEPTVNKDNEILFDLKIEEDVAWKIDVDSLKESLVGLKEIEVRKFLSNQSKIREAKVVFWPFWVKQMPNQKEKVEIVINCENGVD